MILRQEIYFPRTTESAIFVVACLGPSYDPVLARLQISNGEVSITPCECHERQKRGSEGQTELVCNHESILLKRHKLSADKLSLSAYDVSALSPPQTQCNFLTSSIQGLCALLSRPRSSCFFCPVSINLTKSYFALCFTATNFSHLKFLMVQSTKSDSSPIRLNAVRLSKQQLLPWTRR
eukprot:763403-Hanusia_phi.AAC.7